MKSLKQYILIGLASLSVAGSLSSCATVFGGRVTAEQKQRPVAGQPARQVRVGALIADILLFPLISLPVDFATGAIYQPRGGVAAQKAPVSEPVGVRQVSKR